MMFTFLGRDCGARTESPGSVEGEADQFGTACDLRFAKVGQRIWRLC